jgi:hypothetical protein
METSLVFSWTGRRHSPRFHEGVRCIADTRLHNRAYEQVDKFGRQAGVGNMMRGVEAVTCTRRLSQLVVMIVGEVEGSSIVGKYRIHGSVLPVSMMQRAHRIIR